MTHAKKYLEVTKPNTIPWEYALKTKNYTIDIIRINNNTIDNYTKVSEKDSTLILIEDSMQNQIDEEERKRDEAAKNMSDEKA